MSQDINTGDMVMVVRGIPCCGFMHQWTYGHTFAVQRLAMSPEGWRCANCKRDFPPQPHAHDGNSFVPFAMLQKLPPETEDEHTETDQQTKEPA